MSKGRVRLTKRRKAVDGSIPYPGNVNQPNRQFKEWDQYHTFEQSINHELPDMRHLWKEDSRDEIGFGIPEPWGESPTVASVRVAANNSVKLAYFLLGDKVAESVIEDQANDFMLLGPDAINRTLARFSQTADQYPASKKAEDEEEADDEAEGKKAADEEEETEGEGKEAANNEIAELEAKLAEAKARAAEDEEEADDEAEGKEAAEKIAEDDDSDDDDSDDDDEGEGKEAASTVNEMDIELSPVVADEVNLEEDARLAGLFDDDIPADLPEPGAGREASEKKGVKSLGGAQPRVAGTGGAADDIGSIWSDAPDVSSIFQ
jgi:hypothetical protein